MFSAFRDADDGAEHSCYRSDVYALIAVRNEIGARFLVAGLNIFFQLRVVNRVKMAVTSQRSRFSSNGAESGTTRNASVLLGDACGATQKTDLDQFWSSHFSGPELLPQNGSPPKICRGMLVMRP